jgi:hypothetical protein
MILFSFRQIVYLPLGLFRFGFTNVECSPGKTFKVERTFTDGLWTNKGRQVERWLQRIHTEVTTPDLWASVGKPTTLTTAASSPNLDNRPFTPEEQRGTAEALRRIETRLLGI